MTAPVTRIAQAILEDQQGGIDNLEDMETAVRLVLKGILACGLVVTDALYTIAITGVIDPAELEV